MRLDDEIPHQQRADTPPQTRVGEHGAPEVRQQRVGLVPTFDDGRNQPSTPAWEDIFG
jgi:hypothetical protein